MESAVDEERYNGQLDLSDQLREAWTLAAMFYASSIMNSIGDG